MMRSISFSLGSSPTELDKINKKGDVRLSPKVTGDSSARTLDANLWLPRASEHYHISPNLTDYVIVPVPSIISDISNTNGDSVSIEELMRFDPDKGQLAYKTWVGKPTYLEHNNKDITQAKGVILDVFLRRLPPIFRGNHVKVIKLLAYDRTKDPELVRSILDREVNTYSLGMYYKEYTCSVCGIKVSQNTRPCSHTNLRRKIYKRPDNKLVFRRCRHISGFETSLVSDPAYVSATSDLIMDVSSY